MAKSGGIHQGTSGSQNNADFQGAKFIWTSDLDLDNTVIFRTRVAKPGWKPRWNTKPGLDVSRARVALIVLRAVRPVGAHDWHRHEDPQFANLQL